MLKCNLWIGEGMNVMAIPGEKSSEYAKGILIIVHDHYRRFPGELFLGHDGVWVVGVYIKQEFSVSISCSIEQINHKSWCVSNVYFCVNAFAVQMVY
jgi:hypothetical protein